MALVHLASGLIFGSQPGSCRNGEEHRWGGSSCDCPCVFGGCGKEVKGGLQQPLGVVSSGSRRPQQPTLNASFNTL